MPTQKCSPRTHRFCDPSRDSEAQQLLHIALSLLNRNRLEPALPFPEAADELGRLRTVTLAEGRFVRHEAQAVRVAAAEAPTSPADFVDWFDGLRENGPGQFDPLFDYLAEEASYEELRWFIRQEVAGEAGFEDLVALVQIKMPQQAKLELARNYWDEMGRGNPAGMHGPLLHRLSQVLDVSGTALEETVWESLALANLMVALAYNRCYAYHAIGALGAIELTAPTRAVRVVEALDRLGVERQASYYFRLHASIDLRHWKGWRENVLPPILEQSPAAAKCIAEGALMRLNAGVRTFDRYRAEFGLPARQADLSDSV